MDETLILNKKSHSIISKKKSQSMVQYASNFTTHIELAIVLREFYPRKTHLWSLLLKTLSRHRKYLRDSVLTTLMPTENAHRKRRRVRILSWQHSKRGTATEDFIMPRLDCNFF
jgi:hypothetical protein